MIVPLRDICMKKTYSNISAMLTVNLENYCKKINFDKVFHFTIKFLGECECIVANP